MEGLYSLANPPPRKGPPEDWPKWSTGWEIAYRFPLFRGVGPLTSNFVTKSLGESQNGRRRGSHHCGFN